MGRESARKRVSPAPNWLWLHLPHDRPHHHHDGRRHPAGRHDPRRSPRFPSLTVLHDWLKQWEDAGRPAPATYTPTLHRTGDDWDLRLCR